jgi:hypothetical protein
MNRLYLLAATAAAFTTALAADKVDFVKDVKPILENYCVTLSRRSKDRKTEGASCVDDARKRHQRRRKRRRHHSGRSGKKPALYLTTTLPPNDDNVMPPRGEKLKKEQTDILKQWIRARRGMAGHGTFNRAPLEVAPTSAADDRWRQCDLVHDVIVAKQKEQKRLT